jgi:hypothetical protein
VRVRPYGSVSVGDSQRNCSHPVVVPIGKRAVEHSRPWPDCCEKVGKVTGTGHDFNIYPQAVIREGTDYRLTVLCDNSVNCVLNPGRLDIVSNSVIEIETHDTPR